MSQYALNSFDIFGGGIIQVTQLVINIILKISEKTGVDILPLKRWIVLIGELG
jgi:hypothetical protein